MSEGKNEGVSLWLTLALAVIMLLFPSWPWMSPQITLVCGIMLPCMGYVWKGRYASLSAMLAGLEGQLFLTLPRSAQARPVTFSSKAM